MDLKLLFFQAIGGLGMFILGMKLMSGGLQSVAGDRLRSFLEKVSSNRVIGALTGAVVTAVIQSSSATTVTVVGFVSAGLLTLTQAVGVVLGANVGTTITAQLIAFKITDLALPAIALGVGLKFFAPRRKWRYIGEVILGFGLLFYGMAVMKGAFKPLRTHPEFIAFFTRFDADSMLGIMLCVLTGTILTVMVQSSSATVGITMALASEGLLNLPGSIALILGDNIGTTITAELAAIGSSVTAHRAARAHTMFNALGVLYIVVFFHPFVGLVEWATATFLNVGPPEMLVGGEKPYISRYIANAHTMFNIINATVFLLLLPILVKAAIKLTHGEDDGDFADLAKPLHLDHMYLDNPAVALTKAREEIVRMGRAAAEMNQQVCNVIFTRKRDTLKRCLTNEDSLDRLHREIVEYLVQISRSDITEAQSRELASLMRMANNFERVGDTVENIAVFIEEVMENELQFSEEAINDYKTITERVSMFMDMVVTAVAEKDPQIMEMAKLLEDDIDQMREEMRNNHLNRLRDGICQMDPSLIFVNMLNNFEKIGDYCFNISQAVAGVR
jgi:phosphate:Na+ symporter